MEIKWKEVEQSLKAKFVHVDELFEVVRLAVNAKENVILYGPGGHGKSDITKFLLELIYPEQVGKSLQMNSSTTVSDLFGGVDFNTFHNEKILQFAFETSIFSKKAGIIEEMFDGRPDVLLALKEILTSGIACYAGNDSLCFKLQTQIVIGCTNVAPNEFVESADNIMAAKALLERFTFQTNVVWPDYSSNSYFEMLQKQTKVVSSKDPLFATQATYSEVCELLNIHMGFSPRTAMKLWKTWENGNNEERLLAVKYLPNANAKALEVVSKRLPAITKTAVETRRMEQMLISINVLEDRLKQATNQEIPQIWAIARALHQDLSKMKLSFDSDEKTSRLLSTASKKVVEISEHSATQLARITRIDEEMFQVYVGE